MTVFWCDHSFEGILCGVYDAWMSRLGHSQVRLELADTGNLELFCEYRRSEYREEKFQKVVKAILTKLGRPVYDQLYQASLSEEATRADWIYRYLIYGFHYGAGIIDMLQIPAVFEVFQMARSVAGETHLLTGFVRFSQLKNGILVSPIAPKNDVLLLLAPHFEDRLSGENWIIYDEKRQKAAVHPSGSSWVLTVLEREKWKLLQDECQEEMYEDLWKIFHKSISITERENLRCQQTHLPLRYRPCMTEFAEKGRGS